MEDLILLSMKQRAGVLLKGVPSKGSGAHTPTHRPRQAGWGKEAPFSNTSPPSPLHPDLRKLFCAIKESVGPTSESKPGGPAADSRAATSALVTAAHEHVDAHIPSRAALEVDVRSALTGSRKSLAPEITGLLLTTRRAQLFAVFLTKHGHPAVAPTGLRLEAAERELRRARWRAKDTRKSVLTRLRRAHPKFSPKRLAGLVERDQANAVHFFARHIRDDCMQSFNAEWSGLSDPQAHVRMTEEQAWLPLLLHELRYDFGLELQEISDVVTHAKVVRVAEFDLDAVSKMLSRSKRQR
jgi:hypothetical protein